jgi:ectoine hydroxylase-related dioxygenase (phytanoyl-CoA dioxygenase family)
MNLQQEFKQNGFVYLKNVFSTAEIAQLEIDLKEAAATKSGDDVLDKGNLKFHALLMHRSEKIRQFISQAKIIDLLTPLAGGDIWVRWDQAVEKQPGAGTFPWHQDNQYSYLKDQHFQFWISMTSMTADNGGLWVVPGSHKGLLQFEKDDSHVVYKGNTDNKVFISAEPGDVVIFSSFLLHSTTPNITQKSRWAYVIEYMKIGDIDPNVDAPYLQVAKNAKPNLAYLDKLPGQNSLRNILKYTSIKQKIRQTLSI